MTHSDSFSSLFRCTERSKRHDWMIQTLTHWMSLGHGFTDSKGFTDSNNDSLTDRGMTRLRPKGFTEWITESKTDLLNKRGQNAVITENEANLGFDSNTDLLNDGGTKLSPDWKESLNQTLIHWRRKDRFLSLTVMIHWFKHWFAEQQRNESQSWWKDSLAQTLTHWTGQKWIMAITERIHWFAEWGEEQICPDWKVKLIH